jgi:hypothetical protein
MKRTTLALFGIVTIAVIAGASGCSRNPPASTPGEPPATPTEAQPQFGEILGLAIGDPVDNARQKLDPLRVREDYSPDAKEKTGRRIYWKLRETEFEWAMVWGNEKGKITRIRAYYRVDRRQPFSAIGDLAKADSVTAHSAKWTMRRPGSPYFRLVAEGAEQQAHSVYMFSLELPRGQQEESRSSAAEAED